MESWERKDQKGFGLKKIDAQRNFIADAKRLAKLIVVFYNKNTFGLENSVFQTASNFLALRPFLLDGCRI